MIAMPPFLILIATVCLGVTLWLNNRQGVRKPLLAGFHFLLGAGLLETTAMLVSGPPNGATVHAQTLGKWILGRRSPATSDRMLNLHAGVGLLVFVLFVVWVTKA
jgi:hypothetical protein